MQPDVENTVYPVVAVLAWLVALRLLITQIRQPTLQRGFLVAAIGIPGFSYLVAAPNVYHWFSRLTGVPNLGVLVVYGGVMSFACFVVAFLMSVVGGRDYLMRRIGPWVAVYVAAVAVMVWAFVHAPVHEVDAEGSTGFDQLYARAPYVPWLLIVFQIYFAVGLITIAPYCWRWSRQTDRRWMRRGLPFIAFASLLALGYVVPKIIYVILRQSNIEVDALNEWAPLGAVAASFCHIIGFTLCALGPVTDFRRRYQAYQAIYPLWRKVVAPFPDLVLPGTRGPRNPRLALRPKRMRTLLYRRIVEIRDARLRLRPWFDVATADAARERAGAREPTDMDTDASVEAALLQGALTAYAAGEPQAAQPAQEGPASAETRWVGEGDLAAECRWLTAVADQYSRLTEGEDPLVAQAV